MESKEGRSQELSKARTRLTFPRGRVVQPPLQPGIKPDPPPPCSGERDPPPCQGTPELQAPGKRLAAEKMAFHPDTTGSLVLYAPRPSEPFAPGNTQKRPCEHSKATAPGISAVDGLPPGAVSPGHYLVPAPGSYLRQKNKGNLTGWQPALIMPPPLFPPPWHCPAIQPDCLPKEQTTLHSPPRD